VEIGDFRFDPTPVEVDRCDEVVWRNVHDQPHTSTGNATQRWNTGNLAPGATSGPIRFEDAGEHTYICALHPFMEGTVLVS
jgi:plastocyanin